MGSQSSSKSDTKEFGLQQWWSQEPTQDYMGSNEELSSTLVTVSFYVKLKDWEYKQVQQALKYFDIQILPRDVQAFNVIHVTGYDRAQLEGQQILSIFQNYDRQARRT